MPRDADVRVAELRPGLVLHLCPAELEAQGSAYTCPRKTRVRGRRFFLCVFVGTVDSLWLPLYGSAKTRHRILVHPEGRTGSEFWLRAELYWDVRQVWSAPLGAVPEAARAGGDNSTPLTRNRLEGEHLPAAWRRKT